MPNKYEREIEEILRNLERTEPKAGFGRKTIGRMQSKAGARRSMPTIHLSFSEWCLAIACGAALLAGGWAYAHDEGSIVTGIIALIGGACIVIVAVTPFVGKQRYPSSGKRYNNVTRLRDNPFSRLGTRMRLLTLKVRYRKRKNGEE